MIAGAFSVGADSVGRSGTSQASQSAHSQAARLVEAGFRWRAASGLAAGFGYEWSPPLPWLTHADSWFPDCLRALATHGRLSVRSCQRRWTLPAQSGHLAGWGS